jgi:hypothetical protein
VKIVCYNIFPDFVRLKIATKFRLLVRNPLLGEVVRSLKSLRAPSVALLLTLSVGNTPLLLRASLIATLSTSIFAKLLTMLLIVFIAFTLLVKLSTLFVGKLRLEYLIFSLS